MLWHVRRRTAHCPTPYDRVKAFYKFFPEYLRWCIVAIERAKFWRFSKRSGTVVYEKVMKNIQI